MKGLKGLIAWCQGPALFVESARKAMGQRALQPCATTSATARNSALWCLPVNSGVRKDRSNMSHGKAYIIWCVAVAAGCGPSECLTGSSVIVEHHGFQETPAQARHPLHGTSPDTPQDPRMQQTGQSAQAWQQNGQIHLVQAFNLQQEHQTNPQLSLRARSRALGHGKQTSQAWFRNIGTLSPPKSRKPSRE